MGDFLQIKERNTAAIRTATQHSLLTLHLRMSWYEKHETKLRSELRVAAETKTPYRQSSILTVGKNKVRQGIKMRLSE